MSNISSRRRSLLALCCLGFVIYLLRNGFGIAPAGGFAATRPIFTPGDVKPDHEYQKALIVASIRAEDTSWVAEDLPDIDTYVYVNDDPNANLTVPSNKGHEAMTYLTFLIDHYENLPEIMIFVHAHRDAYHNPWLFDGLMPEIVRALNPARVVRHGYVNLHCGDGNNKCWAKVRPSEGMPYAENRRAWEELFPQYPVPQALVQMPAAQFALSRDRVAQIPKRDLLRYRQWLIDTDIPDKISGFVFEFLWQFIFRGEYLFCPRPNVCYCDGFGICMEEQTYNTFDTMYVTSEGLERQIEILDRKQEFTDDDAAKRDQFARAKSDIRSAMGNIKAKAINRGKDAAVRAKAAEYM